LIGKDEEEAINLLERNRILHKSAIQEFNGTWLKEMGDGVLASFNSVTDAVNCALKIQEVYGKEETLTLRIGIHQGEVVIEDNDVLGDGVNIASRIESITPSGSIYVSESVSRNIENKKGIKTVLVGEKSLKNIEYPIRIYEVFVNQEGDNNEQAVDQRMHDNSIAVLPFVNMSSDPEQEYFSDGLTEEIRTDLSRLGKLLVISRSSMMTFKGTSKKISEIANEINVRYILEGSVRKSGNNLRITAQLIDAQRDYHLWAENYNGTIEDIFDIQQSVSKSIVESLDIQLTSNEESSLAIHPIPDPKTLEFFMRARYEMMKLTETGLLNAISVAEQSQTKIGGNAQLYGIMGLANLFLHHYGIRVTPLQLKLAKQQATQSLTFDSKCPTAHLVLGIIKFKDGDKQEAVNILKKVLEQEKDNPDALRWLSLSYQVAGRPDAARPITARLLQIDPMTPETYHSLGNIEFSDGLINESIPYFEQWLQMDPVGPFPKYWCSLIYALNNDMHKSIALLDSLISEFPDLIFAKFALFFKSALIGDKKKAVAYATEELKRNVEAIDYLTFGMSFGYAFINEKDEAVKWCEKTLGQGLFMYPLITKIEIFNKVLKDHSGFRSFMSEVKRRSEAFEI